MNAINRHQSFLDVAAAQAKSEGLSSFGRMTGSGWTNKQIVEYSAAAASRGVEFVVGEDGIGYFQDPDIES